MDKSGRGHLTNEKVYSLMQEQLKMQKSLFQMKKVIVGLLVFVVILALSNLGTSFASAILAKDTTTNSESGSPELVDKKTGEVVATDQAVKRFTAEVVTVPDDDPFTRGLARTNEYGVTTSSFSRMSTENAQALLGDCDQGNKIVKLTYLNWRARTVCGNDWTCQSNFTYPDANGNPDPISGVLCLQGTNPMEYVYVTPNADDTDSYIISSTKPDFLTSDVAEDCLVEADCDDGLICSSSTCAVPTLAEGQVCSGENMLDCDTGLECVAEPVCSSVERAGMPVAPTACGSATSSTVAPGDGSSTDPCQEVGLPFCNNGVCGACDPNDATTCAAGSTRPTCVDQNNDGVYSCGCGEDGECGDGETCGIPDTTCVADISPYCSTDHNADWGCNTVNQIQTDAGVSVSATCQYPTGGTEEAISCSDTSDQCISTIPSGCSCMDLFAPVCGSDGNKYCNSCVAELNGLVWESIIVEVVNKEAEGEVG